MQRFRIFLSTSITLFFFLIGSVAIAQQVEVHLRVETPDAQPAANVYVALLDPTGIHHLAEVHTDSQGIATFNTEPGDYTVKLLASHSIDFPDNGRYKDTESTLQVNSSPNPQTAAPVTLALVERLFKVVVKEGGVPGSTGVSSAGDPVVGLDVSGFRLTDQSSSDPEEYYVQTKTNAQGIAYIPTMNATDTARYGISGWSGHDDGNSSEHSYTDFWRETAANPGPGETLVEATVLKTNATIIVQAVDAATGLAFQLPEGFSGGASCWLADGEYYLWGSFPQDSTNAPVRVVGGAGDYFCRADIWPNNGDQPLHGASEFSTAVGVGATATGTSKIYEKNATIKVRLIDPETGLVVAVPNVEYSMWTEPSRTGGSPQIQDYAYQRTSTGLAELSAISGQWYGVSVYTSQEGEQSASFGVQTVSVNNTFYILPHDVAQVAASSALVKTIDFPVTTSTSAVTVNFTDPDGNPLNGWLEAYTESGFDHDEEEDDDDESEDDDDESEDDDDEGDFEEGEWFGTPINNGSATLALKPGKTYLVTAHPNFEADSNLIPPPGQELTLDENTIVNLTFTAEQSNYTAVISTSVATSADALLVQALDFDFLGCYGYTHDTNRHSYAEAVDGQSTVNLKLIVDQSGSAWEVGCFRIASTVTNGVVEEKYYYAEATHKPVAGETQGSLTLELTEEGNFYPEEAYPFDASQAFSVLLADGNTEIEAPAGAFAASGTGLLTVKSGQGYTVSATNRPMINFDISPTVDGTHITQTVKPVTLRFHVNPSELLEKYGIDPDDLSNVLGSASFNDSTKTWKSDGSTTYHPETETLTVTVKHFSIWAATLNQTQATQLARPTKLKARKPKRKGAKKAKVTFRWTAPLGASDSQEYEVDVLRQHGKKGKKGKRKKGGSGWKKAKTYTATGTTLRKKLAPGNYKFRVRVKGGRNSTARRLRF